MEQLETVRQKNAKRTTIGFRALFKISDEKIYDFLKLIDYGRVLPDVWKDHREEEYGKKIARICDIDQKTASLIMELIIDTIRRLQKKDFVSKRASDLKKLGFKKLEVDRYLKITNLLKKNKAFEGINKIDSWIELSEEVLPSLVSIECAFDIRCGIEKNKLDTSIPIVLLKFEIAGNDTKAKKELVFQADIGSFRHIVHDMTEMYRNAQLLRKYTLKAES